MIAAIIQARMGSSRLPGKVLEDICGKTMLRHVVERVGRSKLVERIIIATTGLEQDDPVAREAERLGVGLYRGSAEDVLDRYYRAALENNVSVIVRVTGDCPLMDPDVVDRAVGYYLEHKDKLDYVSNARPVPTYPEGLGLDVASFEALQRAWREAKLPSEREHVFPYIWKNPHLFRIDNVMNDEDLSNYRWTVDYEADLLFVREVFNRLYPEKPFFGMYDVVGLLREHPEICGINNSIPRDEGYFKSLQNDRRFKPQDDI